jgi:tetratricopeptide (TPR) repeat protein
MLGIKKQHGKAALLLLAAAIVFSGCGPPGPRALLQGKKLLESGELQPAIEKLKLSTVLLGATNAHAFNYLGLAYHQAGMPADAEKAYRRALFLNPNLAEARYNLGCLLLGENRLEQAKTEFTVYTLRRPNSPEGWVKLGAAQWRLRETGAAEKSFGEALRLSPQDPEALTGFGLVRLKRDHAGEAMQLFERSLKAQPGYGPALLNQAIIAQQYLNDQRLALQRYRQYLALKPAPDNAEAVREVVRQLESEMRPPVPSLATDSAPRVSPKTAAIVPTPQASAISSASAADLEVVSLSSKSATKPPASQTARYVYKSPSRPAAGNHVAAERFSAEGFQALKTQRFREAVQAYHQAIQRDPGFYDAYYNLGSAASQAGELETALSAYETALALNPESADARYNFALVLNQAGFPLDASQELQKILAAHPNENRAHLALGNLYAQQLAQADKARAHYLKVLETDPHTPQAAAIRSWLAQNPR